MIGGGCPAEAYVSEPVTGSCTAAITVTNWPSMSSEASPAVAARAARGSSPERMNVRRACRTEAVRTSDSRPWPETSPTMIATRPSRSSTAS